MKKYIQRTFFIPRTLKLKLYYCVYKFSSEAGVSLGVNITVAQNAVLLSVSPSGGHSILQHVKKAKMIPLQARLWPRGWVEV